MTKIVIIRLNKIIAKKRGFMVTNARMRDEREMTALTTAVLEAVVEATLDLYQTWSRSGVGGAYCSSTDRGKKKGDDGEDGWWIRD